MRVSNDYNWIKKSSIFVILYHKKPSQKQTQPISNAGCGGGWFEEWVRSCRVRASSAWTRLLPTRSSRSRLFPGSPTVILVMRRHKWFCRQTQTPAHALDCIFANKHTNAYCTCKCTQNHAHTHALNVVYMFTIMETIIPVISGRGIWVCVPGGYLESRSWLNQIYGYEHKSMMRNIFPSSNKEATILSIDPHHMYQDV